MDTFTDEEAMTKRDLVDGEWRTTQAVLFCERCGRPAVHHYTGNSDERDRRGPYRKTWYACGDCFTQRVWGTEADKEI